ncbi:uncharacterized protein BT62DRAFT_988992 [Guyanagaster necrorhizus]|uniref:Glyoxylate reductase n=1 Tax=Guyanagaster necrorhizus TaxID=856835 RepID=A0A9P7VIW3_9AGAR|nr:uncharacterized protein BT62DRAFT_988992 [Guyanagaster necrorhizus MCA 3950]KAG7441327.1 hypothetical protein BT62DRAFT_988992 [Guyanagaster necrorhizus MCA 3950]
MQSSHLSTTTKPRVVICRNLGPDVMPLLEGRSDVEVVVWPEDSSCDRKWLLEQVRGAAGVLLMFPEKADKALFEAAGPSLRVVSTMSVGYGAQFRPPIKLSQRSTRSTEHIDLTELTNRGVKLGYTPDVLTDAVADITVMLALMASRNAGSTINLVQSGEWPKFRWAPFAFCGPQISTLPSSPDRTVGFLGFGRISQATLKRLIPFGITSCLYTANPHSPPATDRDTAILSHHPTLKTLRRVTADELARSSDIVFVLAPGGESTKHLVDEAFLRKMKKHSVLVNASRGTLVDSDALAKALSEGWIWGAGLDVVEGEPNITLDHPLVKEPRCVILPHIGSASIETRIDMATLALNNLLAGVFGEELPAELKI